MEEVWRVMVRRRAVAVLVGMTVAAPFADAQPPPDRQRPRVGEVLPDNTVRFNIGSTELTDRSKATLDRLTLLLKRRVELSPVLLVGHADDRGSDELNQRLSKGRAEVVKAALVARGIRARRLTTEGAGSREPLLREDSEAARTRNRRVEIWVTPRGPVARVGRVQRRVQAREPAADEWRRAQKDQALRRLARIRTLERSSSEIVFPRDDVVTMGPNALAVIFGSPSATRRSRQATANVEIEEGSLFAALAAREGRVLEVQARASRMRIRSKSTRVTASPERKQATVAVYDGEAEVESAGELVTVQRGFGTRVVDGQPPEPPRRLPPAPSWSMATPIYRLANEPVELGWRSSVPLSATEVQLGVGNDVRIERPVQLMTVRGSTIATAITPGVYVARLAGVDDRGLIGTAGPPRPLIVMPAPRAVTTDRILQRTAPDRPLVLDRPDRVRFFAPPASVLSIQGRSSTVAVDVDLYTSRRVVAAVKAADGGPTRYLPLDVEVRAQRVETEVGAPVRLPSGGVELPVQIRVVDEAGRGVDGLEFRVAGVWATSDRLRTSSSTTALAPCSCRAPKTSSVAAALGDGRYRGTVTATAGAPLPSTVRFYADDGERAVETEVPPRVLATAASGRGGGERASGLFVTAHAGSGLGTDEDPVFGLGLGLGWRWRLDDALGLDTWALARWFRRAVGGDDRHIFPLTARAAIRYEGFRPALYLGAGAGVRVGDVSTKPVGEVFVGALFPLSAVDLDLQAGYTAAGSDGSIDEVAGWGIRLGLRWHPLRND